MRVLRWLFAALLVVAAAVTFNTLRLQAPLPPPDVAAELAAVDADAAVRRLAGALRFATVSHEDPARVDWVHWTGLHEYLAQQFPRVHAALTLETVADYSLLYTWPGRDPALDPVLLLAHQDVVPVEPGTEARWTHPPFAGVIADGYVWGRGALDDKSSLMAILEGAEWLLVQGFVPARTLMFAFGHDEEVGGAHGAVNIAAELQRRGVRAWFTLDEGAAVTEGVVPGVSRPVAFLNVGEKGYLSLRLSARGDEGHSSMPPPQTAVSRVARAVARVQDNPMPQRLLPQIIDGYRRLAPEMPFMQRMAIANDWLFAPLLKRALGAQRITNAMTRTTTASTMLEGGVKDNILPTQASAVINFRILPGETIEDVEAHVQRVIDDPAVQVERLPFHSQPSPVAAVDAPAFATIERAIHDVFPDALVVPSIVVAATDNRHYAGVRDNGYYFIPARVGPEDLARIHGTDERVSVINYREMVQFYVQLMRDATGPER